MITLQFSSTKGLISKLVQFRTWSWASHVDIVMKDGRLLGASWKNGVAIRDFDADDYDRVERYTVDTDDPYIVSTAMTKLGSGYDFKGVLGFILRKDIQDKNSWFCSEFIAWAFAQAGKPLLNPDVDIATLSPSKLLLSPYLERVDL